MKTIRVTKESFTSILNAGYENQKWTEILKQESMFGYEFPMLHGGLDHIEWTVKSIYVIDRGCNGHDNSFVIRISK